MRPAGHGRDRIPIDDPSLFTGHGERQVKLGGGGGSTPHAPRTAAESGLTAASFNFYENSRRIRCEYAPNPPDTANRPFKPLC